MDVNQLWNVANIWCQLIFTWMMWFSWMFDLTFRIYYVWINNTAQIASISVRIISIAVNVLLAFKCLNWFCGHFNHCQYLIFVMTILHSDPVVMYWCAPLYLHAQTFSLNIFLSFPLYVPVYGFLFFVFSPAVGTVFCVSVRASSSRLFDFNTKLWLTFCTIFFLSSAVCIFFLFWRLLK